MKKEENTTRNWLDEIFGEADERPPFDYKNYTTDQLVKIFNLDEPKAVTFLKGLLRVLLASALIALCVFLVIQIAKPIERPMPPVQQPPVVEQTKPQEKPKEETPIDTNKPVVLPPVKEDAFVDEPTVDDDIIVDEEIPSTDNGGGLLESILGFITDTITSIIDMIDFEEFEKVIKEIIEQIKDCKREKAKLMLSTWDVECLEQFKDYVSNHKCIDQEMKQEIIEIVDEVIEEKLPKDEYYDALAA